VALNRAALYERLGPAVAAARKRRRVELLGRWRVWAAAVRLKRLGTQVQQHIPCTLLYFL
jgi:hypothetical protein